jgi:hypothetical protein
MIRSTTMVAITLALLIGSTATARAQDGPAPQPPVGQGAYDGLTALYEVTAETPPCTIDIRGVIFGDAPVPEPYLPE